MKKLYFLNEEEKNRILNIHQNATKRQYLLKEESTTEGTLSDIQKIEFDDALNYDISSPTDSNAARTPVRTIYKFCSKYNWENSLTMTKNEIDLIVARIQSSLMKGRYGSTLTGRGVSDEANKSFLKEILNFKNVPNFCYAVLYGDVSRSGEKNILTIFDEVSFTFQDILKNIKSLAKISPPKKIESDPAPVKKETDTSDFGCVAKLYKKEFKDSTKHTGKKYIIATNDKIRKDSYVRTISSDVENVGYYNTGAYYIENKNGSLLPSKDGEFYRFFCEDGGVKLTTDIVNIDGKTKSSSGTGDSGTGGSGSGTGGSGSGWISINSKYDKEILQALGKTGDKLTDDDIKDIYNKLKSAGKIK